MERRRFQTLLGGSVVAVLAGCVTSTETEEPEPDITLSLAGMRATGVSLSSTEKYDVETALAEELDVHTHDVRVRPEENTIEVVVDVSESEFLAALTAYGLDVESTAIHQDVSEETRAGTISVLTARLEHAGMPDANVERLDEETIGITLPNETDADIDELFERGTVQLVAGYPVETAQLRTEELLTDEDIASIGTANADRGSPKVPVTLTEEGAQRFVQGVQESGFTTEGVGQCSFDSEEDDEPLEGQYCIYTVVDGEYVAGHSLGSDLARTINEGNFEDDPRFVMLSSSMDEAEQLELYLRSGALPVELDDVEE